ncbi:hypothetical protein, partial [Klebsiella pneumoniae]|uniref:hypothetical protein n=1 Tax=Klebsiella pneumoniae TaxID=573 RepID=UPI0022A6BC67
MLMIPCPRAGLNPFLLSANGQTGNQATPADLTLNMALNSKSNMMVNLCLKLVFTASALAKIPTYSR